VGRKETNDEAHKVLKNILNKSNVATRLPAQDLERARKFYVEKLGLEPIEERPGGLKYRVGTDISRCLNQRALLPVNTRKWHGRLMILRSGSGTAKERSRV